MIRRAVITMCAWGNICLDGELRLNSLVFEIAPQFSDISG